VTAADAGASEIAASEWRQGSIASAALAATVAKLVPMALPPGALLVIASHDCDVANPSFEREPNVEFLVANPIDTIDGSLTAGKSPRQFHLEIETTAGLCPFEIRILERFSVRRNVLLDTEPTEEQRVPKETRMRLAQWLAKRYQRPALPTAFEDRLRPAKAKIRKILSRKGGPVEGLFLSLDSRELPNTEVYKLILIGVITLTDDGDVAKRNTAQACIDELAALLNESEGIEVLDSQLKPDSEFTLNDFALLTRWDFDWLSGDDI